MSELQWQYSRSQRRHYVCDGEVYAFGGDFHDLIEIHDNAPYSQRHKREHGYRLLYKGEHKSSHRRVAALKYAAEVLVDKDKPIVKVMEASA